jgi:hypothetical protein
MVSEAEEVLILEPKEFATASSSSARPCSRKIHPSQ